MNNVYYGVSPSSDFFAHYGVKGMKWGVRRAIERGNQRALARHYNRAAKKLAKLSKRTDIELQNKKAKNYGRLAKAGLGIGLASAGTIIGSAASMNKHLSNARKLDAQHKEWINRSNKILSGIINKYSIQVKDAATKYHNPLYPNHNPNWRNYKREFDRPESYLRKRRDAEFDRISRESEAAFEAHRKMDESASAAMKKRLDNEVSGFNKSNTIRKIATGVGGASLLGAGIAGAKAYRAKKRTTPEGHQKAISERNAWKREMDSAFKGTKYEGQYDRPKRRRGKR